MCCFALFLVVCSFRPSSSDQSSSFLNALLHKHTPHVIAHTKVTKVTKHTVIFMYIFVFLVLFILIFFIYLWLHGRNSKLIPRFDCVYCMMQRSRAREETPTSGSQTITTVASGEQSEQEESSVVLRLQVAPNQDDRRVTWDEEVIDNENMGKKSSKGIPFS